MESEVKGWLPSAKALEEWLALSQGNGVEDLLEKALLAPLNDFLDRPSKHFRAQLVQVGFDLVSEKKSESDSCRILINQAMNVLEAIHAASLVVDDIQDNSEQRRGKPTLHREYGIAVALNSANWLYFWPLEIIQSWNISSELKMNLIRACNRALIKAHSGQALDVGTPMTALEQSRVYSTCLASLELKTGALTALALELGALLGGATEFEVMKISPIGIQFGVALQMFDDLGNLRVKSSPDPKRFEDLKGERPSWVWAAASQMLSAPDYQEFIRVVKTLPDEKELLSYLSSSDWPLEAKGRAAEYLDDCLKQIDEKYPKKGVTQLLFLSEKLKRSYE